MSKLSDLNLKLGDKIRIIFNDKIGGETIYVISQMIETFSPESAKNSIIYFITQEGTNETVSMSNDYDNSIMNITKIEDTNV